MSDFHALGGRRQYGSPTVANVGGWFSQVVCYGSDEKSRFALNMEGVPLDPKNWFVTLYRLIDTPTGPRWVAKKSGLTKLDIEALYLAVEVLNPGIK